MDGPRTRILILLALTIGLANIAVSGRTSRRQPLLPRPRIFEDLLPGGQQNNGRQGRNTQQPAQQRSYVPQQQQPHQQQQPQQQQAQPQQTAAVPPMKSVEALEQDDLIKLVEQAIDITRRRYLDVNEYTPWQIMHGILALRHDHKVRVGNKLVRSIDYVSAGAVYRGENWFEKTPYGGRGHPFSVPYAFEGHTNQFAALLCMSALPANHTLKVRGGTISMADIVQNAKMTVNSNEEITWTLWFLTQYIRQDSEWVNQQNQRWSMAELVRHQVQDPVYNAPCGGTHGLFALAFSRNAYVKQQGQLRGVWLQAEYKLRQHIELARQLQNPDGSFSTQWFRGRGFSYDFQERLKCSGHMLEWLMMALPHRRLEEVWVRRAVQNVASDLIRSANSPVECGPLYHALHALKLYHERVVPEQAPNMELAAPSPASTKPQASSTTPAPEPIAPNVTNTARPVATPKPQTPATPTTVTPAPVTSAAQTPAPMTPAPKPPQVAEVPPEVKPQTKTPAPTPKLPQTTGTPEPAIPLPPEPPMTAAASTPVRLAPVELAPPPRTGAIMGTPAAGRQGKPSTDEVPLPPAERPLLVLKKPVAPPSTAPSTTQNPDDRPLLPTFAAEPIGERDNSVSPDLLKPAVDVTPTAPVRVSEGVPAPAEPKVQ